LDSIEDLAGSFYDDHLFGDDGANGISGHNGNDMLKGYGGSDTIAGDAGDDILMGLDGDDLLIGGKQDTLYADHDGHDTLVGGLGRDILRGGSEADTFVWSAIEETNFAKDAPSSTLDVIEDFNPYIDDLIDLSGIDADVFAAGNQAFVFVGAAMFTQGHRGELRYRYEGGNTILEMQTGNDIDVEGAIVLTGIHTPDESWFVL
jgi:Ca2+-binding RTX toxin-like protein